MCVPAVGIVSETTPDEYLGNSAVYGSTRAQATDILNKICVSGFGVHNSESYIASSVEAFLSLD